MIKAVQKHQMQMSALAISQDGDACLYGGGRPNANRDLYLATFDDDTNPRKVASHSRPVAFASFLRDGAILSASWDRNVIITDMNGEPTLVRDADSQSRYPSYAVTHDSAKLVFGSKRGELDVFSTRDLAAFSSFSVNTDGAQVWCIAAHPKSDKVLVGSASGEYGCWNLKTQKSLWSHRLALGNHIQGAAWTPDGRNCIIASAPDGAAPDGSVSQLHCLSSRTGMSTASIELDGPQPRCCDVSRDGNLVAVGCGRSDRGGRPTRKNCHVIIAELTSGNILHRFDGHTDVVERVAFRPNHNEVVSVSFDGSLRRWTFA